MPVKIVISSLFLFLFFLEAVPVLGQELVDMPRLYQTAFQALQQSDDSASYYVNRFSLNANQKNMKEWQMKSFFLEGILFKEIDKVKSRRLYINAANIAYELDSIRFLADIKIRQAYLYKNAFYIPDSALFFFREAKAFAIEQNYLLGEVRASTGIAYLRMDRGEYLSAMDILLSIRNHIEELDNSAEWSNLMNNIGHTYMKLGLNSEAIPFFKKAYGLAREPAMKIITQLNTAEAMLNLDSAKEALALLNEIENTNNNITAQLRFVLSQNKAACFLKLNLFENAYATYQSIYAVGEYDDYIYSTVGKARAALGMGDTLMAYEIMSEIEADVQKGMDFLIEDQKNILYQTLSTIYTYKGDYKKALSYMNRFHKGYAKVHNEKIRQDIFRKEANQRLHLLERKNELEKTTLSQEIKIEKQQIYLLSLISLLLFFAVMFLMLRFRQKKNIAKVFFEKNVLLEEQKKEISRQSYNIEEANVKIKSINENLEQTILDRTKEILQKNKTLEEYAFINAHKLRAPVARIKGLYSLCLMTDSEEEKADYLNKIANEINDLDELIMAIRDVILESKVLDRSLFLEKEQIK